MPLTPEQLSLIGAGVNSAGGIITNIVNRKNVRETNEQRERLFREQMRYNDSSEQMKRQMAAGLHPMTMSGLQPTDAPTAPDVESYEARNPFNGYIDGGLSMANQMIQEKQLGLTEQQIEVQRLKITVDALNAVTGLLGENATTEEALMMLEKITGLSPIDGDSAVTLHRDETLINSLKNQIEMSNLSVEEKRITVNWLERFKQAEFELVSAQSSETRSRDALNQINAKVAESVKKLNEAEFDHLKQLTANLQEQWKSLNFQGELDARKLLRVQTICDSYVKELSAAADISNNEANYWVWKVLMENYKPASIGPLKIGPGAAASSTFNVPANPLLN